MSLNTYTSTDLNNLSSEELQQYIKNIYDVEVTSTNKTQLLAKIKTLEDETGAKDLLTEPGPQVSLLSPTLQAGMPPKPVVRGKTPKPLVIPKSPVNIPSVPSGFKLPTKPLKKPTKLGVLPIIKPTQTDRKELEKEKQNPIIGFTQTLPLPKANSPTVIIPTLGKNELPVVLSDNKTTVSELSAIQMPQPARNPMTIQTPLRPSKISLPSIIKLPQSLPAKISEDQKLNLSSLVPTNIAPMTKEGFQGLPIDTDFSTLDKARFNVNTPMINPEAQFQKMIPAPEPDIEIKLTNIETVNNVELPNMTGIVYPKKKEENAPLATQSEKTIFKPLKAPVSPFAISPIPTSESRNIIGGTKKQANIYIPSIKVTAAQPKAIQKIIYKPGQTTTTKNISKTQASPLQNLPPAIRIPTRTPYKPISVAYVPQEKVLENITQIKENKLHEYGPGTYSLSQLRAIAVSINLSKEGDKKQLIARIRAAINKYK